jgi:hypothetical protein
VIRCNKSADILKTAGRNNIKSYYGDYKKTIGKRQCHEETAHTGELSEPEKQHNKQDESGGFLIFFFCTACGEGWLVF